MLLRRGGFALFKIDNIAQRAIEYWKLPLVSPLLNPAHMISARQSRRVKV